MKSSGLGFCILDAFSIHGTGRHGKNIGQKYWSHELFKNTPSTTLSAHQEHFGVQYLAQGHFDMQTRGINPETFGYHNKTLALPLSRGCLPVWMGLQCSLLPNKYVLLSQFSYLLLVSGEFIKVFSTSVVSPQPLDPREGLCICTCGKQLMIWRSDSWQDGGADTYICS